MAVALCFSATNASRVSNEKLHLDDLNDAEVVGTTRFPRYVTLVGYL